MSALRRDDQSLTLMDDEGYTYVVPLLDHDYDASKKLNDKGIQRGEVVYDQNDQPVAVRYPSTVDFVSLPSILNASRGVEDGSADVDHAIELTRRLFIKLRIALKALPLEVSIDSIAIDKGHDKAEILPPYIVSSDISGPDALKLVFDSAMKKARTSSDQEMISNAVEATSNDGDDTHGSE